MPSLLPSFCAQLNICSTPAPQFCSSLCVEYFSFSHFHLSTHHNSLDIHLSFLCLNSVWLLNEKSLLVKLSAAITFISSRPYKKVSETKVYKSKFPDVSFWVLATVNPSSQLSCLLSSMEVLSSQHERKCKGFEDRWEYNSTQVIILTTERLFRVWDSLPLGKDLLQRITRKVSWYFAFRPSSYFTAFSLSHFFFRHRACHELDPPSTLLIT